ncbi:protein TIC 62, chloroplastic isoform X2 [Amborella trichopoda]|uniref:protein TIC 62, chloroplastic isoform X2 n=1 Tax=Amborella trichopoda TaxID=13333 RepID=UPI0009BF414E|nr:protein TIC 62, chloroplastic isoform X2 [Amborella trichopoda]|eukprot:XP_020530302.1 protein TIC 62, chloroplastic isoform X2 [Amborella trichopoda]
MALSSVPSSSFSSLVPIESFTLEKTSFLSPHFLTIPRIQTCPQTRKLKFYVSRAQASGPSQGTPQEVKNIVQSRNQEKDDNLAFVAGATGRVGSRTVSQLVKLGFHVRAGVRSRQKAEEVIFQRLKIDDVETSASGNSTLFWGVLIWKRKAEEALMASGLPFTIVRPGGMERPTDAYKETHNIVLAKEDTYFGGQVSNLQVAELMAFMGKNRDLSCNKVVEVIAETTAPLLPMGELLSKVPPQGAQKVPLKDIPGPVPSTTQFTTTDPPTPSVVQKEVVQSSQATRPLSPFTVYEDLKPPTSPTPTPSSGSTWPKEAHVKTAAPPEPSMPAQVGTTITVPSSIIENEVIEAPRQKSRPLSPYTVYEDLKPPSSPCPLPKKF